MSELTLKIGPVLLDSNCAIEVIARLPVAEAFFSRAESFIPVIVVGELIFGAYNSRRRDENLSGLSEFLEDIPVLDCDSETAEWYAKVRFQLQKIGRPIPANDMWIAALALQHGLKVASKDTHFDYVEGLERIEW